MLVIERVRLVHIYQIEFDGYAATSIGHSKIEPLCVTPCVNVGFTIKSYFSFYRLEWSGVVATLESRFENRVLSSLSESM